MDYFGNVTVIEGVLRVMFPSDGLAVLDASARTDEGVADSVGLPTLVLRKHLFEDRIRFSVTSDKPLGEKPYLFVRVNSWDSRYVPLRFLNLHACAGALPWDENKEGLLVAEVVHRPYTRWEQTIRDSLYVFSITAEGGRVSSADGSFRVEFPKGAVYRSILGYCREERSLHPSGVWERSYSIFPQDVPLRRGVKVSIDAQTIGGNRNRLGVYAVGDDGHAVYVGGQWSDGMLCTWTNRLARFTVLADTTAPEITFVDPEADAVIRELHPRITVGFADSLSGISGEDNYLVFLDGNRLIVEYDPSEDRGFHWIETPLSDGEHFLEVRIQDRAGNVSSRRHRFTVIR
jgi:hypothetical protein